MSVEAKPGDFLCPYPVGGCICAKPLPCAEHDIPDQITGHVLYGSIYVLVSEGEIDE